MLHRLTLRNLTANKGRFALSTFGVLLAVSFVVSAFVLGDGLRKTFGELSAEIVSDTDLEVRPSDEFGQTTTITDADVAAVAAIDGVAAAAGDIEAPENAVRPILANGGSISTNGPPQLAFGWIDEPGLSAFALVEGTAPGPGEFVIDIDSAAKHNFVVGDSYTMVTPTGRHELTLTGLKRFGTDNATLGATLMSVAADDTSTLFGTTGYDSILVAFTDTGRSQAAATTAAVQQAVGSLEVADRDTVERETAAEFNSEIDLVQNILLGFAGVSLLVSVFIIYNTFAIVLAQRTREMGLLRLIGAEASALRRAAIAESLLVGVIASIGGIGGGIAGALGLTALFSAIGVDLPAYDIVLAPRTLIAAAVVGIGVTLIASMGPARAAARLSPIAAFGSSTTEDGGNGRTRTITGSLLLIGGIALTAIGFTDQPTNVAIAVITAAAVALVVAVTLLSPIVVGPIIAVARPALNRFGVAGAMATRNASRQPRRTATSAAALMIGLAVVSLALVVGESFKADLRTTLADDVRAEYLLTDQTSTAGFPPAVTEAIEGDARLGAVTGISIIDVRIATPGATDTADETVDRAVDGEDANLFAVNLDAIDELFEIGRTDNGPTPTVTNRLLVENDAASERGLSVGDEVAIAFAGGESATATVTGTFTGTSALPTDWLLDATVVDDAGVITSPRTVAFSGAADASDAEVTAAVATIETLFPAGDLETAGEFRERMEGLIDQVLSVLNALVALAVIIALIGIANTLALAVNERTREIGLLRAVGMSRRQVRRMVRYESAMIAGFGALLGTGLGVAFGWIVVTVLPDDLVGVTAIPVAQIVVLAAVAIGAGLAAALLPARRAARMDVLHAIAH